MADKRTQITRSAVKEGMLELLGKAEFNDITVASLCREAGVGRSTFYTHYMGLTDVIDELADEAIGATKRQEDMFEGISVLAEKLRSTSDRTLLDPYMDLLPICQRVADNPKYNVLFKDSFVSEYIVMRIFRQEREFVVSSICSNYPVAPEQAEKVFLFTLMGAFEVNRAMGWKKDAAWLNVQKVLMTFLEGGYAALARIGTDEERTFNSAPGGGRR